jgi:ABC-2 type transport system permease protein
MVKSTSFGNFRQAFSFSSYLTSMSIITERSDGTWDRALVAGVRPYHFIISHLTEGMVIGFLQFLMYAVYMNFILTPVLTFNIFVLVTLILFLQTASGVTFGMFVSTITGTVMGAFIVAQVFCYPIVFISGILWPIQAANEILQVIGKLFPFAFATAALRSIMVKDTDFFNEDTYMAFFVMIAWIVVTILLSFKFIDRK